MYILESQEAAGSSFEFKGFVSEGGTGIDWLLDLLFLLLELRTDSIREDGGKTVEGHHP